MENETLKPVLESIIFAADSPVSLNRIAGILEGETREAIKKALADLVEEYRERAGGIFIEEVAGGYVFRTNSENAAWIKRLFKTGLQRISKAAMETLAIVAYNQPVTRSELEAVRGVDSAGVLSTLLDKRFVRIVGRKETPGRPVVYGTTKEFLETFDLKDLACLPSLKEIQLTEEDDGHEKPGETEGGQGTAPGDAEAETPDDTRGDPEAETPDDAQADTKAETPDPAEEGADRGPREGSEDNRGGRGDIET